MKFKTPQLEEEFTRINLRLKIVLKEADEFLKDGLTITSLFRHGEDSVHHYGRGADIRIDMSEDEGDRLLNHLNTHFIYGGGKKVAIDERDRVSNAWTGPHIHLQVPYKSMRVI